MNICLISAFTPMRAGKPAYLRLKSYECCGGMCTIFAGMPGTFPVGWKRQVRREMPVNSQRVAGKMLGQNWREMTGAEWQAVWILPTAGNKKATPDN